MRYTVEGADRQTGRDVTMNVEASSEEDALQLAAAGGIVTSRAFPSPAKPAPVLPYGTGVALRRPVLLLLLVCGGVAMAAAVVLALRHNRAAAPVPPPPSFDLAEYTATTRASATRWAREHQAIMRGLQDKSRALELEMKGEAGGLTADERKELARLQVQSDIRRQAQAEREEEERIERAVRRAMERTPNPER